jgi:hypothetical protein
VLNHVADVIGPQQIPDATDGHLGRDGNGGDPVGDQPTARGCACGTGKVATGRQSKGPRCGSEEQEDRRPNQFLRVIADRDVRSRGATRIRPADAYQTPRIDMKYAG